MCLLCMANPKLTRFQTFLPISLDSGGSHGNDENVPDLGIRMLAN
jgi:hypothetical protein